MNTRLRERLFEVILEIAKEDVEFIQTADREALVSLVQGNWVLSSVSLMEELIGTFNTAHPRLAAGVLAERGYDENGVLMDNEKAKVPIEVHKTGHMIRTWEYKIMVCHAQDIDAAEQDSLIGILRIIIVILILACKTSWEGYLHELKLCNVASHLQDFKSTVKRRVRGKQAYWKGIFEKPGKRLEIESTFEP